MTAIDWGEAPEGAAYANGAGVFLRADVYGRVSEYEKGPWRKTSKHLTNFDPGYLEERPAQPAWDGEGLPPVGTRCEFTSNDGYEWRECVVLFKDGAVVLLNSYELFKVSDPYVSFRPIRTSEQIAAENREIKAQALFELVNPDGDWHKFWEEGKEHYRAFIDAGYLKQEKHDE